MTTTSNLQYILLQQGKTTRIKYPDKEYQNVSDSSEGESSSAEIVEAQQVDANQQIANENRLFYRILTRKLHL